MLKLEFADRDLYAQPSILKTKIYRQRNLDIVSVFSLCFSARYQHDFNTTYNSDQIIYSICLMLINRDYYIRWTLSRDRLSKSDFS